MNAPDFADLARLPIPQRLKLLEDRWDTLLADPGAVEIPDWHRTILDERLAAYRANPDAGIPWEQIRQRLTD